MKTILAIQCVAGVLTLNWMHSRYLFSTFRHYGEVGGPTLSSLFIIAGLVSYAAVLVLGAIAGLYGPSWVKRFGVWVSCACQIAACFLGSYYVFLSVRILLPPNSSPFGMYYLLLSVPVVILSLIGFIILLRHITRTKLRAEEPSLPT